MGTSWQNISEANVVRCRKWHGTDFPRSDNWGVDDWANALFGEAGEFANVVKKIRRTETNMVGAADPEVKKLYSWAGEELADTATYLDLLCHRVGFRPWEDETILWYADSTLAHFQMPAGRSLAWASMRLGIAVGNVLDALEHSMQSEFFGIEGPDRRNIENCIRVCFRVLFFLAHWIGVDLRAEVVKKFNAISERESYPDRVEL